jgi:tetratricopeptide (TPR) repeat protein
MCSADKMSRVIIVPLLLAATILAGCSRTPQEKETLFLARGKKYVQARDYPRALLEFSNAASAMPKDAEPFYQMGLVYADMGSVREAVRAFGVAVNLNPKHTEARLRRAELMARFGNQEVLREGQKDIQALLAAQPESAAALNALALAEVRLGDMTNAEQHLQQALDKLPQSLQSSVLLARLKLAQRDPAGAEDVLKKAVQQAPKSADAVLALGHFYLSTGKRAEAEAQFRNALNIDPKNASALIGRAAIELASGKRDQAERTYKQISELPDKRYKHVHAAYLLESGQQDAAIKEFERLAREDSRDRDARARLVSAYLVAGKFADAEKALSSTLKRNPKDVSALLQRSVILLRARRLEDARKDLADVLRTQPDSAEAHYILAQVYGARKEAQLRRQELGEAIRLRPGFLAARIELSQALLAAEAAKTALEIMDAAPENQHGTPSAIIQRNWVLYQLRDQAGFSKGVAQALAAGKTPDALIQDGFLKLWKREYVAARSSLEDVLKQRPDDLNTLSALMESYSAQKQVPAGLKRLREHAAQMPKSVSVQNYLGEVLLANGSRPEAREAFGRARAADPGSGAADIGLAKVNAAEGKFDEARKTLYSALSKDGNQSQTRLLLALIETKLGNQPAAIEQYRKVLETEPQSPLALNNLAYLLAGDNSRLDEALKYAQQVQELQPNNPGIEDTIGWIMYRKGLYGSAVQHLKGAVSRNGNAALYKYHLAMAYAKSGNRKLGQETLEAAFKLNPNLPEAAQAKQVLSQ